MRAADADDLSAWPHGFRDGLRGALALIADRLGDAATPLRGRFALVEDWRFDGDVYHPSAWPLACDAALATFAASVALDGHPAFELARSVVRDSSDVETVATAAEALLARLGDDASWEDWYTHAFLRAHSAARGGAMSRCVALGQATAAAGWAAELLRWALEREALTPEEIVALVESWAPEAEHLARVRTPGLAALRTGEVGAECVAASWPGLAIVADGTTDRARLDAWASSFATKSLDDALGEVARHADALRGLGVIALRPGGRGTVWRSGSVEAWVADDSRVDTKVEGELVREGATWALHVGAMEPRRPTRAGAGLVAWTGGANLDAFAALREPASPRPHVPRWADARVRAEALVSAAVPFLVDGDATGLDLRVRFEDDAREPVDGALERDVVVVITVVRADVDGAADEDAAAEALRARLPAALGPLEVDATDVK
ncbi:MAG: hypothetical protein KC586_21175 [Myxococcales bacterium]|nr:hypothetical protein [Myxococcales bacterium]